MTSERAITKQIMRYLQGLDRSWWMKVHGGPYQKAGVPDILGCYRGRFFAFEVKVPGGKTTAKQDHEIQRIRDADGVVDVVTSRAEVESILKKP